MQQIRYAWLSKQAIKHSIKKNQITYYHPNITYITYYQENSCISNCNIIHIKH